jgi:small subunit ribosomal protein S16
MPVGKLAGQGAIPLHLLRKAFDENHENHLFDCRRAAGQARIGRFRRTDLVLTIRLSRIGKKKKPFYRVVVIERTRPRDGRVKEAVGTYDPLKKPAEIKLNADRIKYWIGLGAQPSDTVRSFLRLQKIA